MRASGTAVEISRRTFLIGAMACGGCGMLTREASDGAAGLVDGAGPDGEFGGTVRVGTIAEVDEALADTGVLYLPQGRAWIVAVPEEWREPLKAVTDGVLHDGFDAGYAALFQTCPHLGCRVPECVASGQFECPCHGSVYGPLGEKRGGPAPRGLDRFEVRIEGDELVLDTGSVIEGLPIGTELGEVEGPGCVEVTEAET